MLVNISKNSTFFLLVFLQIRDGGITIANAHLHLTEKKSEIITCTHLNLAQSILELKMARTAGTDPD